MPPPVCPPALDPAWSAALDRLRGWFSSRGWTPLPFQERAWAAYGRGESGLIHVPTGAGKTYAATLGPLADLLARGGRLLHVSPLRAMSRDLEAALRDPVDALGLPLRVESRTGDTPTHVRARQKRAPPGVLVTTPESLSLLLSDPEAPRQLADVRAVVVDEWHELLDAKRGTQVELALCRLRRFSPELRVWALTATLHNLEEAARAAVGAGREPTVVTEPLDRPVRIETLLPDERQGLPWAGHLGVRQLPRLLEWLDIERSTLLFCNTRAQSERWYRSLADARPGWADRMALHHGSVDREERERVEAGLKDGSLTLVVCTASLDLGVDLAPVERVAQIGSPKGIARLLQRAGRSGHRPGSPCHVLCVPTHALQLVEIAAVRDALARGEVEPRRPLPEPLDVLAQHLVTCALGGGWTEAELLSEVRSAWSYRDLSAARFAEVLALVRDGGGALRAYPEYRKVVAEAGRYGVPDARIAQLHRGSIGTITGDTTLTVRWANGATLGTIDETFVARLEPGDPFVFAGRLLELVRIRDVVVQVRPATRRGTRTPHWPGTRLPISGSLGAAVRRVFQAVRDGTAVGPEVEAARELFAEQARLSRLPRADAALAEVTVTEEGHHLFLYPFEGRAVHEGLAALLALRWSRHRPMTLGLAVNDYGIEFHSARPVDWDELLGPAYFTDEALAEDVLASVNLSQMARRRFRDIARIAGLVNPGAPHQRKTQRQVMASAGLLYDVFRRYDPENLLLQQARREVLEQELDQGRLRETLARLRTFPVERVVTPHPTPLAFPLVLERIVVDSASTETLLDRVQRLRDTWSST